MKVLDWNITDLEKDVLVHGIYDYVMKEYEHFGAGAWSNNIHVYCKNVKSEQMSGVISSLVKKGLLTSFMDKDDFQEFGKIINFTKDGFRVLNELVDDGDLKGYVEVYC